MMPLLEVGVTYGDSRVGFEFVSKSMGEYIVGGEGLKLKGGLINENFTGLELWYL